MRLAMFLPLLLPACARMDVYYPPNGKDIVEDERGRSHVIQRRALVLNGTDSLGGTSIDVTSNGIRIANAGGFDNSTSTREGYRTVRFGIAAAAWAAGATAIAGQASSAYGANQAANASSNVAASRAAAATAASKGATTVRLAEIAAAKEAAAAAAKVPAALPAAGSTINAVVPATVVPVP
jgi:hypothetical protein